MSNSKRKSWREPFLILFTVALTGAVSIFIVYIEAGKTTEIQRDMLIWQKQYAIFEKILTYRNDNPVVLIPFDTSNAGRWERNLYFLTTQAEILFQNDPSIAENLRTARLNILKIKSRSIPTKGGIMFPAGPDTAISYMKSVSSSLNEAIKDMSSTLSFIPNP